MLGGLTVLGFLARESTETTSSIQIESMSIDRLADPIVFQISQVSVNHLCNTDDELQAAKP